MLQALNNVVKISIAKKLNKKLTPTELDFIDQYIEKNNITSANLSIWLPKIMSALKYQQQKSNQIKQRNCLPFDTQSDQFIDREGLKEYQKTQIGTTEEDNVLNPFKFNTRSNHQNNTLTTQDSDDLKISALEVKLFLQLGVDALFNLSRDLNPTSKEYYSYILIDTFNVDSELSTNSRFVWRINDGPPIYQKGIINLPHKLYPIKRMRIGRLTFANIHQTEFVKIYHSQSNRIATTIHNFSSQSIIAQNGLKFHFQSKHVLDLTYRGNTLTITPFFSNRGWFNFYKPHRNTDILDMSFTDIFTPLSPIIIHDTPASITGVQTFGVSTALPDNSFTTNYIRLDNDAERMIEKQYPASSLNELPDPEYIANGTQQVIISGFTTNDPVADAAVIAAYNGTHILNREGAIDDAYSQRTNSTLTGYWTPPVDVSGVSLNVGQEIPITITWINLPRLTGVLELISELPPGEKIN